MFAVSAIGHVFFLLILILTPSQLLPARSYTPSVINVSMVSLPPEDIGRGAGGPAIVKPEPDKPKPEEVKVKEPKPAEVSVPEPKKQQDVKEAPAKPAPISVASAKEQPAPDTISLAPKKKKVKKSLKKKTFRSTQVIKRAIKKIEKKRLVSRSQSVNDAIDRLRKEVKESEKAPSPEQTSGTGTGLGGTEQGSGIPGRFGIGGRKVLEQIDLYKLEIAYQIEKKWAFSEQLSGGRTDLEAILIIKIMANGEIREIWFEKKSGNNYFDDSAYKAIKKSNPLPPLPKGYVRPFYNVGLVFTPSGLMRRGAG
jgi:colicin import membrane protein